MGPCQQAGSGKAAAGFRSPRPSAGWFGGEVLGAREIPPTLGWRGPSRGGRDLCEGGAGG